jgi:hypothetical protein
MRTKIIVRLDEIAVQNWRRLIGRFSKPQARLPQFCRFLRQAKRIRSVAVNRRIQEQAAHSRACLKIEEPRWWTRLLLPNAMPQKIES